MSQKPGTGRGEVAAQPPVWSGPEGWSEMENEAQQHEMPMRRHRATLKGKGVLGRGIWRV